MIEEKMSVKKIAVTGDLYLNWFEVQDPPVISVKDGTSHSWKRHMSLNRYYSESGALLLARLVGSGGSSGGSVDVSGPILKKDAGLLENEEIVISEASLICRKVSDATGNTVSRHFIDKYKGFRGPVRRDKPLYLDRAAGIASFPASVKDADLIVIDDTGNGFRDEPSLFPSDISRNAIVVCRMHSPRFCSGLWDWLTASANPENIVIVVNSEDIRKIGEVAISCGSSWESTAMDFVYQIQMNPNLQPLKRCANLVVLFGMEGAILYNNFKDFYAKLFFDPKRMENFFQQECRNAVPWKTSVFTAGLCRALAGKGIDGLDDGIVFGLQAVRHHVLGGLEIHGGIVAPTVFDRPVPVKDAAAFGSVIVQRPKSLSMHDLDSWSILLQKTKDRLLHIAENIVIKGWEGILDGVPEIQFGSALKTFDRKEIESYSGIQKLIREYINSTRPESPLNIAVFGPPGSGKSFAVKQIALKIDENKIVIKTFNLSQMSPPDIGRDFAAALHQVRDICISGKVPLVFFDEFDCDGLRWLKYFLAPMQDGVFTDGGMEFHIGMAIFVFAGGTCSSYKQFSSAGDSTDLQNDRIVKKPDFLSRLRGFSDLLGPNQGPNQGPNHADAPDIDEVYIIRRAKVLRSMFERVEEARGLFSPDKKTLNIDSGILRALLRVPYYRHGNRSMQAIIQMSRLYGRSFFDKAMLPPKDQLQLHVDADEFVFLMEKERFYTTRKQESVFIESVAREYHVQYVKERKFRNQSIHVDEDFDKLPEDKMLSNIHASEDIPCKLRLINMWFRPVGKWGFAFSPIITDREIELLAESEHNRWRREQEFQGWNRGESWSHDMKTSSYLCEYRDLPEEIKEYNRDLVKVIPVILAKLGYEIFRIDEDDGLDDNDTVMRIARTMHERYLAASGSSAASKVPFEKLDDYYRRSNIDSAFHIPHKLKAAGYGMRKRQQAQKISPIIFADDQIGIMSCMEHQRWIWERRIQDGISGESDDRIQKIRENRSYMVPYDDLPDKIKEYDRINVRLIPELLMECGYELFRMRR